MAKKKTSFTLTEDAMRLLLGVSEKKGISMAAVLELLIRDSAKKEGVK